MTNQKLPKILAIDDDQAWLDQVPIILEDECQVESLPSIDQGLQALEVEFYDIVLLDLNFEGDPRTGLEIFRKIHALDRGVDVVVISGETNPQRLIEVFSAGVTRFISKPASPDQIRTEIRKVLHQREMKRQIAEFSQPVLSGQTNPVAGTSAAVVRLREDLERILAAGPRDILIQGETGTGKELLARYIAKSMDRNARFYAIHCGAIADGLIESELFGHVKGAFTGADRDRVGVFEAAAGGFVFLDEIGEMPMHQQAKLLRVLQERAVQRVGTHEERKANFRTISATHVDLTKAIQEKRFREDLYYRIARVTVRLPSLRERIEDLPDLATRFLAECEGKAKEFTEGALFLLSRYEWPGNIRQLKAVVENLQFRANDKTIREKDICVVLPEVATDPLYGRPGLSTGPLAASLLTNERKRFEKALIQANGSRDEAAKLLGLSRATYFRRAKELGLVDQRKLPRSITS